MKITKARFITADAIEAEVDGQRMTIPATPSNRHYRELMGQKVRVAPYAAPPAPVVPPAALTIEDVLAGLRAEGVLKDTPAAFAAKHAGKTRKD